MAISYGLVDSRGNGRVYDVTMASGDTTGTLTLNLPYVPTFVTITPCDIVLTAAQVAAATGSGTANTYAGGVGFHTDTVKIATPTATSVVFTAAATVLKSFRVYVGRVAVHS